MAAISYTLKTERKDAHGRNQIFLVIWHEAKRARIFTGESIQKSKWDTKKQRQKTNTDGAFMLNQILDSWYIEAENIIRRLKLEQKPFTIEDIRKEFVAFSGKKPDEVVIHKEWTELFEDWIKANQGKAANTIRNYNSSLETLKEYVGNRKFEVKGFDREFINDYIDWMFDEKEFEPGYAEKKYTNLRSFIKWVHEKNLTPVSLEAIVFRPRRSITIGEKPAVFLKVDELYKLYEHTPTKKYLEHARDSYLIMCLTALRHSDAQIDETIDRDGGLLIKHTRKKNKNVFIPVSELLDTILQKYNGKPPYISGQKHNDYIKEVAKEAGLNRKVKVVLYPGGKRKEEVKELWQVLSTKSGRKTFVSNGLAHGMNELEIMKVTGNNKLNLRPYHGIEEESFVGKVNTVFKKPVA